MDKVGIVHEADEKDILKQARSGSSTSGVYSSAGSVESDSPDSNSLRKRESVHPEPKLNNKSWTNRATKESDHVSRLTVGFNLKSYANV